MTNLQFIPAQSASEPALYIAGLVNGYLRAGKRVLLLLPGGSSINVAVAAYKLLDPGYVSQLALMLTDERYGDVGHADSNWLQLEQKGLQLYGSETAVPVLVGASMADTVARYNEALERGMGAADVVVGFFGMGEDGHTGGALPGSPAVASDDFVVGYDAGNYQRITMTPHAIAQVDDAILFVMGESKRAVLQQWQTTELELDEQPAQVLKKIPALAVFSDVFEEAA